MQWIWGRKKVPCFDAQHLSSAVTSPCPVYFHILPSRRITITFTLMFVVKTFVSEKHFGLDDRGQRGMEENITVDIKAETSNAVAPAKPPTSFSSVTVLHYFPLYLLRTAKRQSHYSHQIQFSQAVRLLNFFQKATVCARFASHPGHNYSDVFRGFPQSYQVNFETEPDVVTRRLPSTLFPIHCSSSSKH